MQSMSENGKNRLTKCDFFFQIKKNCTQNAQCKLLIYWAVSIHTHYLRHCRLSHHEINKKECTSAICNWIVQFVLMFAPHTHVWVHLRCSKYGEIQSKLKMVWRIALQWQKARSRSCAHSATWLMPRRAYHMHQNAIELIQMTACMN